MIKNIPLALYGVSGQIRPPTAVSQERENSGSHGTEGWVSPAPVWAFWNNEK